MKDQHTSSKACLNNRTTGAQTSGQQGPNDQIFSQSTKPKPTSFQHTEAFNARNKIHYHKIPPDKSNWTQHHTQRTYIKILLTSHKPRPSTK